MATAVRPLPAGSNVAEFFFSVSPLEVASRDLTLLFLSYVIEKIFPAALFIAQLMLCDLRVKANRIISGNLVRMLSKLLITSQLNYAGIFFA